MLSSVFFFFKQKTAYEMRISDWSSDVCSSDLIYIRHTVRQDLWQEAVGSRFPDHASMADTYRDELRFMQAVRRAFEANGLAPRDMVDVQSALYVVHSYTDEDAASFSREAIEAAMDAYDSYRQSGEHSDLFDAFGESRDYWVRSPREERKSDV